MHSKQLYLKSHYTLILMIRIYLIFDLYYLGGAGYQLRSMQRPYF